MLLEIFTDRLCSKPSPPTLDILWWKVLFFKTWISVVFSTVFLKILKNINFQFFSHFWSLKCRTLNGSTTFSLSYQTVFTAVWRFTLFCSLRGDVYQRSTGPKNHRTAGREGIMKNNMHQTNTNFISL